MAKDKERKFRLPYLRGGRNSQLVTGPYLVKGFSP